MAGTRGVFFDLYGTLLVYGDMAAAWRAFRHEVDGHLRSGGLSLEKAALVAALETLFTKPAVSDGGAGLTIFERRLEGMVRDLGRTLEPEACRAMASAAAGAWQRYVTLDPEALPLLRSLKPSRKLALVTNFDHPPHIEALLAEHGLAEMFDTVVISGAVGVSKPDPAIFAYALEATGLPPQAVLHVGDANEDVEGARAAGICPVRITRDDPTQAELARAYQTDPRPIAEPKPSPPPHRAELTISSLASLPAHL